MASVPFRRDIHYPESDGKPMGETEVHVREIMYLFQAFNEHLREVPDVYVGAALLLYYMEGNARAVIVPDVFVARGVPRGERRVYKLWKEGQPPSVVIEVTSDSTHDEDMVKKKSLYERLGVEEYILHDPLGDYLTPALQGFQLVKGHYRPMTAEPDGALRSRALGATFRGEDKGLRVIDTATGRAIPSHEEVRAALAREIQGRRAAEEELARLRAELDRLRGQS